MPFAGLTTTTATIKRKATTQTAGGGEAEAVGGDTVVYDGLAATIQPANGRIVERFQRRTMVVDHVMYVDAPITLKTDDVVYEQSGRIFQVKSSGDMGGRGVATVVYLQETD